ncbi:hypothetical protein LUZ60_012088 [Juncus effusus]|nr:hypothetical protein LUZ60_012088 [Juncus effusus]
MGGDWQDLGQVVFITLIFGFLLAKLISLALSIKHSNLTLTRNPESQKSEEEISEQESEEKPPSNDDNSNNNKNKGVVIDSDEEDLSDESDGSWEGIESTELDEEFSAASAFIATMAATSDSARVSNDVQLKLYGLYKIATEGPCTTNQPSALNFTARAKWNAWQKLGAMPTEEAMQQYISLVNEMFPTWDIGSSLKKNKNKEEQEKGGPLSSAQKGPMGPVFSSLIDEETDDSAVNLSAIHIAAREGAVADLHKQLESGVSVDLKETEGRSPLHWAVDRGNHDIISTLLSANADVNAKDNEGQTPLHYAVVCEREKIAELLLKSGADRNLKDNDGNSPLDLCDSEWPFMNE